MTHSHSNSQYFGHSFHVHVQTQLTIKKQQLKKIFLKSVELKYSKSGKQLIMLWDWIIFLHSFSTWSMTLFKHHTHPRYRNASRLYINVAIWSSVSFMHSVNVTFIHWYHNASRLYVNVPWVPCIQSLSFTLRVMTTELYVKFTSSLWCQNSSLMHPLLYQHVLQYSHTH